jgi:hypothetical protein
MHHRLTAEPEYDIMQTVSACIPMCWLVWTTIQHTGRTGLSKHLRLALQVFLDSRILDISGQENPSHSPPILLPFPSLFVYYKYLTAYVDISTEVSAYEEYTMQASECQDIDGKCRYVYDVSMTSGGEYVPLVVDGETYYTAAEAARYLHISRDTFYGNVKAKLQPYKHGALKRVYYRQSDLDALQGLHPIDREEEKQDQ